MGFFGLFVSMIGLGAMAKDAISDSISATDNCNKAKINNEPYYFGAGSNIYSTKTGRRVERKKDYTTNREWLVEIDTGNRVEDLTTYKNNKMNNKEIAEARSKNCVFYETHEFDNEKTKSHGIYKSTLMDGYFKKDSCFDAETRIRITYYIPGKVVKNEFLDVRYEIKAKLDSPKYFEDGVLFSDEEFRRRAIKKKREREAEMEY